VLGVLNTRASLCPGTVDKNVDAALLRLDTPQLCDPVLLAGHVYEAGSSSGTDQPAQAFEALAIDVRHNDRGAGTRDPDRDLAPETRCGASDDSNQTVQAAHSDGCGAMDVARPMSAGIFTGIIRAPSMAATRASSTYAFITDSRSETAGDA